MKNLILITSLFILISGCEHAADFSKSYGNETTQLRNVGEFKRIVAGDKFDIELVQDSMRSGDVEITAGSNVINGYTSKVNNGELVLTNTNKFNWVRKLKIRQKVVIYFRELNELQINGSAKFTTRDSIRNTSEISINHGGLEDADLKVSGNYIFVDCANTGGVNLNGSCFLLSAAVDDISFLNARHVKSKKTYLTSFSKLDSYINGAEVLEIRLFGNGNVFYDIIPSAIFKVEDTGSGNVIKN